MKNIIILSMLNPWSMGAGKGAPSFYNTIVGYSKDWNVSLIVPYDGKDDNPVFEEYNNLRIYTFQPLPVKAKAPRLVRFIMRLINSLYITYKMYRLGAACIGDNRNTIIYAYEVHAVKAGKLLSIIHHQPLVTRFQGSILYPIKNNLQNRLRYYPHFGALRTKADVTIMTDDGTFGDVLLKRLGNHSKKICFWKNGVDFGKSNSRSADDLALLRNKYMLRENEFVLLTVSRLVAWKHVDRAIEALRVLISKGYDNIKLIIVGDGEAYADLVQLVSSYKLQNNVVFTGSVKQFEIESLMDIADVFLSLYDLSNVGNPLLEAMSKGKVIITLNTGTTSSIIENNTNGIILDLNCIENIPESIIKIKNDTLLATEIGNNAKEYATKHFWTWSERIETEIDVVREILLDGEIN